MKKIALVALLATLFSSPVYAQGINSVQDNLQSRINSGLANGSLSATEASKLQQRFDRITQLESKLRDSGGGLTQKERSRLANELSDLKRSIAVQKRDNNNHIGGANPPGPAGGPGAGKNWNYNPPGKRGGPGQGWNRNN